MPLLLQLLQSWAGLAAQRVCSRIVRPVLQRHAPRESPRDPLICKTGVPKKTYSDTMTKPVGACWLAVVCVLLFSQLAAVKARGIKHRIKWNRKALPGTSQVTEAQRVEMQIRPGAFIKHGRRLDIDFGAEGNRYYEANYWQFPDEIHYNGCSEANVTKEKFVTNCINATQAANQEELLAQEKQNNRLHQRILWRLIRELCSVKQCEFWLERGAGRRVTLDQSVMLCLLVFHWLIVK